MPKNTEVIERSTGFAHRYDALPVYVAATMATLLVIFLVYFESFHSMVAVWLRSETFLHGFIILPISLYLIWRKWPELRRISPTPFFPGAFVLLVLSFVWLMSDLLGIQVGTHFTVVAMVPTAVLTVMGLRFTQAIAFPLAYLIFAVPFGQALIPILIDFTATFTVKALNITGIPVIRDGRYFSIPSGNFEVATACSGIRYLLATLALGTLYGYLNFRSFRKRAIFFVFSVILPIIANGFRAYGIVLLAHYSDMKIAVDADHLIYGWIFFGVVITILFLAGNRFLDAPVKTSRLNVEETIGYSVEPKEWQRPMLLVLPLVLVSSVVGPVLGIVVNDDGQDHLSEFAKLPDSVPGWQASNPYNQDFCPDFSGASRELYARYDNDGQQVNLAVIQYVGHQQDAELANMKNSVLNESGSWRLGKIQQLSLNLQSGDLVNVLEVLATRRGSAGIVWYWFSVNGRTVNSPLEIKLREAQNLLIGKRSISTAVIFSIDVQNDIAASRSALQKFVDASYGPINKCLILAKQHPDCGLGIIVLRGTNMQHQHDTPIDENA